MSAKVIFVFALMSVALAAPRADAPPPPYGHPPPAYPVKEPGMPFDFAYAVKDDYTGNDFAHDENSNGEVTSGSYRVALPDGRTQIVKFTADHHNGYVANVEYKGEAKYPASAPSYPVPAPSYPAPPPAYPPPPPVYA